MPSQVGIVASATPEVIHCDIVSKDTHRVSFDTTTKEKWVGAINHLNVPSCYLFFCSALVTKHCVVEPTLRPFSVGNRLYSCPSPVLF